MVVIAYVLGLLLLPSLIAGDQGQKKPELRLENHSTVGNVEVWCRVTASGIDEMKGKQVGLRIVLPHAIGEGLMRWSATGWKWGTPDYKEGRAEHCGSIVGNSKCVRVEAPTFLTLEGNVACEWYEFESGNIRYSQPNEIVMVDIKVPGGYCMSSCLSC